MLKYYYIGTYWKLATTNAAMFHETKFVVFKLCRFSLFRKDPFFRLVQWFKFVLAIFVIGLPASILTLGPGLPNITSTLVYMSTVQQVTFLIVYKYLTFLLTLKAPITANAICFDVC